MDPRYLQGLVSGQIPAENPGMGATSNTGFSDQVLAQSTVGMTPGMPGAGRAAPAGLGGIPGGLGQGGFGMGGGGGFDPMGMPGGASGGFGGGFSGDMSGLADLGAPSTGLGMTPSMEMGIPHTDIEMDTFAGLDNVPPIPRRHFGMDNLGGRKYNFSRNPQQFSNQRWGEPLYGAGPVKRFPAGESISSSFARYA
jgi:hypothetical protein|tara:strand:+ start:153 stop:740 length:588 start_codon:yes stop_codon:yes gene_type:complete